LLVLALVCHQQHNSNNTAASGWVAKQHPLQRLFVGQKKTTMK